MHTTSELEAGLEKPANDRQNAGWTERLHRLWDELEPASRQRQRLAWGIAVLVLLGALNMYGTWLKWGNLSIDAGHEMYVPGVLSEGQMLYRDVWYHYGPGAPYFNGTLFRIFGRQLSVLNAAGALAALGSAIFLFLSGSELSFGLQGWIAGAVMLTEAFHPGLFCFPLPYSFASVYGCLLACALLWVLIRFIFSGHWGWTLAAGMISAVALIVKLEYGVACYGGFALASLLRAAVTKSAREIGRDVALALPGVAICAAVVRWMVSIHGAKFITQENIMSWPGSFFMRTYGKAWLAFTGLSLNLAAWWKALLETMFVAGVLAAIYGVFCWKARGLRANLVRVTLFLAPVGFYRQVLGAASPRVLFTEAFFPRAMVLYSLLGAGFVAYVAFRKGMHARAAAGVLTLAFAGGLALRILLGMTPSEYPIYYNGPAVLAYLMLASALLDSGRRRFGNSEAALVAGFGCLSAVTLAAVIAMHSANDTPLRTAHGTVVVPASVARNYEAAIAFLKEKNARGEAVLVLPEDTSLYFLSDTHAPTRVYAFNPGMLAPGKMTKELFSEIEQKHVKYLLWSNRTYPEYGVPAFGRDFNQELAAYLKANFKMVGTLTPDRGNIWELSFLVWERRQDEGGRP